MTTPEIQSPDEDARLRPVHAAADDPNHRPASPQTRIPSPDRDLTLDTFEVGSRLLELGAVRGGNLIKHPDGLVRAVGQVISNLGFLLMVRHPRFPWIFAESRAELEDDLKRILRACEKAGVRLEDGPFGGIPRPDDIGWCARRVSDHLACIDFHDLPASDGFRAEPAIAEDPETIASALERVWFEIAARPCPLIGAPLRAAIRDMQARLDDRWVQLHPHEKARQVVMCCLQRAGIRKPSAFFDADRKSRSRAGNAQRRSGRRVQDQSSEPPGGGKAKGESSAPSGRRDVRER